MDHLANEITKEIGKAAKVVETGMQKAWSILDAASEKRAPGEYLSQKAVNAIQGKTGG
ncbi:MAG: hypothetical protein MUC85_00495 [Anaerolineales bacterium]|jgi:hypothetical protein|nr:hypothetical protein [Anaerolineales bacterium]